MKTKTVALDDADSLEAFNLAKAKVLQEEPQLSNLSDKKALVKICKKYLED